MIIFSKSNCSYDCDLPCYRKTFPDSQRLCALLCISRSLLCNSCFSNFPHHPAALKYVLITWGSSKIEENRIKEAKTGHREKNKTLVPSMESEKMIAKGYLLSYARIRKTWGSGDLMSKTEKKEKCIIVAHEG